MNGKRRMYLWPKVNCPGGEREGILGWDVLWLTLALTVMLAGCAAVAALDTYEGVPEGEAAGGAPKEIAVVMVEHGLIAETVYEENGTASVVVECPANPWGVPLFDEELETLYATCEAYRMAPELGLSLIWVESRYDREAVNGDCYGLCQLKEKYFPGVSAMTGAENIRAGMTRLGELLEEYDNLDAALCAYRWGNDTGDRRYAGEVLAKLEEFAVECY